MPTTAERHALLFLAAVAAIGTGARLLHVARTGREFAAAEQLSQPAADASAIDRQIGAVDSVRSAGRSRGGSRPGSGARTPRSRSRAGSSSDRNMPIRGSERVPTPPPGPVDLNLASAAEIERLPRIGPALAQRIVAWREAHGPFRSMDDLRHVRGIGPATAALLAESVTF